MSKSTILNKLKENSLKKSSQNTSLLTINKSISNNNINNRKSNNSQSNMTNKELATIKSNENNNCIDQNLSAILKHTQSNIRMKETDNTFIIPSPKKVKKTNSNNKYRIDFYGNKIIPKHKKHKVTFKDKIKEGYDLIDVVFVKKLTYENNTILSGGPNTVIKYNVSNSSLGSNNYVINDRNHVVDKRENCSCVCVIY